MLIKSKILRDLTKVLSGNVVAQGVGFLILIIVSKELGPQNFGIYSLFISIYIISCQLTDFGISTSFVKYGSSMGSKGDYNNLLFTISISKIIMTLVFSFLVWLFSSKISAFFFLTEDYKATISILSLSIVLYTVFSLITVHYHTLQNFKVYFFLNILVQIIKLCGIITIVYVFHKGSAENLVYMYVYSFSILIIIYLAVTFKNIKHLITKNMKFQFKHLVEIYSMGLWVFLSSISVLIMMRLDIIMLQKMSTSLEVGYYSLAMQLAMIIPIVTSSITITLLPKVDSYIKDNSFEIYISKILKGVKYTVILLLFIEIVSPYVIQFVFGVSYLRSITIFQILVASFIIGVIINPISILFYTLNKAYILTLLNWFQILINFVANLYFIPLFQANGAAISTSMVKIFGGIYIIYFVYREINQLNNKSKVNELKMKKSNYNK